MATTSKWRFICQIILEMTTYILLKMAHWNNKTVFFLSYIIEGLETYKMYYEGNMVLVAHVVLMFGWIPRCCSVVAYKNSLLASK